MTRRIAAAESPVGLLDGVLRGIDWTGAACVGMDTELWFPERGGDDAYSHARDVCASCPLRERCLKDAMSREGMAYGNNRYGMWGGATPWERHELARERKRRAG